MRRADLAYAAATELAATLFADGRTREAIRRTLLDAYRDSLWPDEIDAILDTAHAQEHAA